MLKLGLLTVFCTGYNMHQKIPPGSQGAFLRPVPLLFTGIIDRNSRYDHRYWTDTVTLPSAERESVEANAGMSAVRAGLRHKLAKEGGNGSGRRQDELTRSNDFSESPQSSFVFAKEPAAEEPQDVREPHSSKAHIALAQPDMRKLSMMDSSQTLGRSREAVSESVVKRRVQMMRARNPTAGQRPAQVSLVKKIFGIGPFDGETHESRVIYPLSPFAVGWTATTCVFLLYTAVSACSHSRLCASKQHNLSAHTHTHSLSHTHTYTRARAHTHTHRW